MSFDSNFNGVLAWKAHNRNYPRIITNDLYIISNFILHIVIITTYLQLSLRLPDLAKCGGVWQIILNMKW